MNIDELIKLTDEGFIELETKEPTEEEIIKIVNVLKKNGTKIPYEYDKSYALMDYCLENKEYEIIDKMFLFSWDDDYVKGREEKIVNCFINTTNSIPFDLQDNENIMLYCLKNNKINFINDKLILFNWNEDFIKNNINLIMNAYANENELPYGLDYNHFLLEYCLENDKLEFMNKFSILLAWPDELVEKYVKKIVNFYENNDNVNIPYLLSESKTFVKYILREEKLDFYRKNFLQSLEDYNFEEDFLIELLKKYNSKNKIPELIEKTNYGMDINNEKVVEFLLKEKQYDLLYYMSKGSFSNNIIENNINNIIEYLEIIQNQAIFKLQGSQDLIDKFIVNPECHKYLEYIGFSNKILNNDNILELYSNMLKVDKEILKGKIINLNKKNDLIFSELIPKMLEGNIYSEKNIEKLIGESELQLLLSTKSEKEKILLNKIITLLNKDDIDLTYALENIIKNINNFGSILENVEINDITDEILLNYMYILQRNSNLFEINTINDLKNETFDRKRELYFNNIEGKIRNKNINIEELREAVLEKKYGLSLEIADLIYHRYCINISELKKYVKEDKFDKNLYNILLSIASIYKFSTIEKLEYLYENSDIIKINSTTSLSLESAIRKEYAKLYSQELYKLNESHIIDENSSLKEENKEIYDILLSKEYNGKKPTFYLLDGDFNLCIHALSAYHSRDYTRPDNFKNSWEQPMGKNHGICTSYIGNDQIAHARIEHPVYGFSNFENAALLLAGNFDLGSNHYNEHFSTSMKEAYSFYPPEMMKRLTMHTHNELVLDRRIIGNNSDEFKRMPDYVVYFVDDINNKDNFNSNNELFNETLQASVDFNIPIVIVDKLKYIKKEAEKQNINIQKFKENPSIKLLRDICYNELTNRIGTHDFSKGKDVKEYNKYYTDDKVLEKFKIVINMIDNFDMKLEEKATYFIELGTILDIAIKENNKGRAITGSMHEINEKLIDEIINYANNVIEKYIIEEEKRYGKQH